MRSWEPTDGPVGPLDEALADCAATGFSGVLRVIGAPGGTVYLVAGGVAAIETPGAPGAEVILLRSGRIAEADWEAAFAAAAVGGSPPSAELIGRGLIGAGELEAVLRTALADAMFAFASGFVDSCRAEASEVDCALPLDPPADAGWLLTEALRRIHVMAAFPGPALRARDRVTVMPGAGRPGSVLGGGRDEILALADGRRSGRDLAFALGHGLYAVMHQLARMRAEGLVAGASHERPPRREARTADVRERPATTARPQPACRAARRTARLSRAAEDRRAAFRCPPFGGCYARVRTGMRHPATCN